MLDNHSTKPDPLRQPPNDDAESYLSMRAKGLLQRAEDGLARAGVSQRQRPFYRYRNNVFRSVEETVTWETFGTSSMLKEIEYRQDISSSYLGKLVNKFFSPTEETLSKRSYYEKQMNPDVPPYVDGHCRLRLYTPDVEDAVSQQNRYGRASAEGRGCIYVLNEQHERITGGASSQTRMHVHMMNRLQTITTEELRHLD